jgi:dTDP-4-amino-4,6-dideoxygalactose transaminase
VGAAVLAFRQAMHEHSVATEDTYPILAGKRAEFPNAYDLAERMVLIPCNASLRPADLRQVGTALSAAWKATVRRGFAPGRGTGP